MNPAPKRRHCLGITLAAKSKKARSSNGTGLLSLFSGRGGRIRTYGLVVPNDARYRAALHPESSAARAQSLVYSAKKKPPNQSSKAFLNSLLFRRSGRIRTYDLQHPMLARYQATLHPEGIGGTKVEEKLRIAQARQDFFQICLS